MNSDEHPLPEGDPDYYLQNLHPKFSVVSDSQIDVTTTRPRGTCSSGPRLWVIAEEAGLRPRGMIGVQTHIGPGDEVGLAYLVESLRVHEPLFIGTGVATAEEIGVETFEQRLRDEWARTRMVVGLPPLMSAWATTGPE